MNFNNKRDQLIYITIPSLCFVLLPLTLVTGPFLSDLSLSIISIIFLVYCFKNKNFSFFKKKYFYFFLIFWIYLVLNSLFNNINLDSIKISFFYFRFGVFFIAVYELIKLNNKIIDYFFNITLVVFSILIVDGYYQYFSGSNIFGWPVSYSHRVSSLFGDELILGSFISRLWPLFLAILVYFNSKKKLSNIAKKYFCLIILILSYILVFFSGERTAFFLINLALIFILLFTNKNVLLKIITVLLTVLTISSVTLFNDKAKKRLFDQTFSEMNITNQNEKIYIFSKNHTHHYITAIRIFNDNKLFGVGVKNFRKFCKKENYIISELGCSTHPHNNYIQLLAETGLIGFSFIFSLFFLFSFQIIKHVKDKIFKKEYFTDLQICILAGIIITLWPIASTGSIFNNWLNIIYYLYIPFFIWSFESNKNIKFIN